MTVNDLLIATLKLIGAIAKSETPDADEMADAFARLNSMIDGWAAQSTTIYAIVPSTYPLVAGQQVYQIGPGAPDFNAVRPLIIQDAGIITTTVTPNFELPMTILTEDQWAQVTIKAQASTLAWYLYYDKAFPLGNIKLWPVPNVGGLQLALYVPTQISQFANPTDTIILPPSYEEALRYNLAVRLCPEWGRPLDPVVGALAAKTFATLQVANKRLDTLGVDASLIGAAGNRGVFNWITGASM